MSRRMSTKLKASLTPIREGDENAVTIFVVWCLLSKAHATSFGKFGFEEVDDEHKLSYSWAWL